MHRSQGLRLGRRPSYIDQILNIIISMDAYLSVQHYETGSYSYPTTRLDDAEYGRALDTIVKGCVDLLLQDEQGRIMIGKRRVHPQPDYWFIPGGRMRPGHSVSESASTLPPPRPELPTTLSAPGLVSHTSSCSSCGFFLYGLPAASRHAERETGLKIDSARFTPVCTHSMTWQWRQQVRFFFLLLLLSDVD